jgi:hypothetical protein
MPVVVVVDGLGSFFCSNECSPRKPLHVHVQKAEAEAKVWLEPAIEIAAAYGFNSGELRDTIDLVIRFEHEIRRSWDGHFRS